MSPEQAWGKLVDRRTGVWALGCVLYECLTGRRAFRGGSLADTLAAILSAEPDWDALPPVPSRVRGMLSRCLDKEPRSGLRDAGEGRVQFQIARTERAGASDGASAAPIGGCSIPAMLRDSGGRALRHCRELEVVRSVATSGFSARTGSSGRRMAASMGAVEALVPACATSACGVRRSERAGPRAALGLVAVALVTSACASFSDGHLPQRSLAEIEAGGKLSAITYEFAEWNVVTADEALVVTTPAPVVVPSVVQARVEPILRRAFAGATRGREQGEWHLDMYYRETEVKPALSYTLALFWIVSLGIIPAFTQTDLYLEARLLHDGAPVQQYVYEETVTAWIHWFLLPWVFSNDPIERKSELLDNMVLNLVHDIAAVVPRAAAPDG